MSSLALYCKSYSTDLRRLVRLAESIRQFNGQGFPFYVSVPEKDLPLFREHLSGHDVQLLADSEIVRASPRIDLAEVERLPGNVSQQIVKSEFWRLGLSDVYLCLDSDAVFIRPIDQADFMTADGTPYTMLDEAHDLLEDAMRQGKGRVIADFNREADQVQALFGRVGRRYSFGPFPLVWHRAVWQSLDEKFLKPRGMNFADAIVMAPIESRWYGEALLAYEAVKLLPCQALFKVYHYAWQYDRDKRLGMDESLLSKLFVGAIYQSSWERNMDWPSEGGTVASRVGRRLRRLLRHS